MPICLIVSIQAYFWGKGPEFREIVSLNWLRGSRCINFPLTIELGDRKEKRLCGTTSGTCC